jgi:polyferredoxin
MNTKDDKLSPQQSLDLITDMINQAKGNIQENSFYYLLWGWAIILAHLGSFVLTKLRFEYPFVVWLIVVPTWIISIVYGARQAKKQERPITHLEKIYLTLLISFGIMATVIPLFGSFINYQINPIVLLICSMTTFTSGVILKFKPLVIGGITFFTFGLVSFFLSNEHQSLLSAIAIALGYLVPGYLLKSQK